MQPVPLYTTVIRTPTWITKGIDLWHPLPILEQKYQHQRLPKRYAEILPPLID